MISEHNHARGIMDQGLAAVLGALVGALATGGGAYFTAKSSERTHMRQMRREAYLAFLHDVGPLLTNLKEFEMFLRSQGVSRSVADVEAAIERVRELDAPLDILQRHTITVALAGPDELANYARAATRCLLQMRHILHVQAERFRHDSSSVLTEGQRMEVLEASLNEHVGQFEYLARRIL